MNTEEMVAHIQELQKRSDRLDAVMERAGRGLDFALGRPKTIYWQAKIDAYTAVLEVAFGLPEASGVDVPSVDK
jgi:hypothetical protein